MTLTLDSRERLPIATQLAEMKALQNLLISNDQLLLNAIEDEEIRQRLQEMLKQDQKNLGVLDTMIVQYGVPGEPEETHERNLEETQRLMEDTELTLSEKVLQHELLKHQQTMAGLIVHKAAQIVGADVEIAIAPLHTINFENRAHQEQLKGILEVVGVRELTGQDPAEGLLARGEDAIAALTGVVGSVVTRSDDEMSLRDLLFMDHRKTDILFAELLGSDNPQKIQEYFGQLYRDVKVHGLAEEQVFYPALNPYYEQMGEIVEQTDHTIEMLDAIKPIDPADPSFKTQIEQLRLAVREHFEQEEGDVFPRIKEYLSHEQQKQLATDFKAAKSQLQDQEQEQKAPPVLPLPMSSNQSELSSQSNSNQSSNRTKPWFIFMNQTIPWKLVFQTKAVINWVEAIVFLIGDRGIREFLNTEPLVNPEYSQLFYGAVFLIGIGYWWVSQDVSQNHGIVKLGILIQFSVFAILAYHTLLGSLHPLYLVSGVFDLIFAVLFSLFLYSYQQAKGNSQTREILE